MQVSVFSVTFLWSCMVFPFAKDVEAILTHQRTRDLNIEWGVSGRKGKRPEMQDAYAVQSQDGQIIFSLYDGHGRDGAQAAYIAASRLPDEIFKNGEERAYTLVDDRIESSGYTAGTTALTARVIPQADGSYKFVFAWAGDSRAVLSYKNGLPCFQTIDHKPEDPVEHERIRNAGGVTYTQVYKDNNGQEKRLMRVARQVIRDYQSSSRIERVGGLSFTRALGDANWSNELISPEPEIITTVVQPGHDGYLILASDGLWDVVSTDEAAHIVSKACPLFQAMDASSIARLEDDSDACIKDNELTEEDGSAASAILAARALRDAAYMYGSTDNITALVVRFMWEKKHDVAHDGFEGPTALQEFGGLMCCVL